MIPIKFEGKKIQVGGSKGVVIPIGIAKLLEENKTYIFTIKEVQDELRNNIGEQDQEQSPVQ